MEAAMVITLNHIMQQALDAGHGGKQRVYEQAACDMGISVSTLQRKLQQLRCAPRKQRKDKGNSALTRDEALAISAYLRESCRDNGKKLASIQDALDVLRANGVIRAERINPNSGEVTLLNSETVRKALYNYRLHPDQLAQGAAKSRLATRHPNQLWQIDPSLCVLYYLPAREGEALQVMRESEFYKNKPNNIRKIEKERVWRYVITDHTSGVVFVHYVLGAESGKNLVDAFIAAMTKTDPSPFHGVPEMVMVDPGSANTGAVFRNLCNSLGVELLINKPGQPWAKGQVEKANDIVERSFEHRLRMMEQPPTCLEELNALVIRWTHWFNATQVLARTRCTRYSAWMRIKQEELIIAPDAALLRELAHSAPESRQINSSMEFSFGGKQYSASTITTLMVGDTVQVARNAWDETAVRVIAQNEDGEKSVYTLAALNTNEYGFSENAAYVGEEYKGQRRTILDENRDEVDRMAMDAATNEEAAAKRKAKNAPFGGRIDPMKPLDVELQDVPEFINKRGDEHELTGQSVVEETRMTNVHFAMQYRNKISSWDSETHIAWLNQRYPEGVYPSEVNDIINQLNRLNVTPLQVVAD